MRQAIGHYDIRRLMNVVVAANLVENLLGYGHLGCFAFDEQERFAKPVEHQNVRSFPQLIQLQTALTPDQRFRIAILIQQQMHDVLPHPFFRRNEHILLPQHIENIRFPPDLLRIVIKNR